MKMQRRIFQFGILFLFLFTNIAGAQQKDTLPESSSSSDLETEQQPKLHDEAIWEPSDEMYKDLPYYLSGYDFKGRPVFIVEIGHWNFLKYLSKDGEGVENFTRYSNLFCDRLSSTSKMFNTSKGIFLINDHDGLSFEQVSTPGVSQAIADMNAHFKRSYDSTTSSRVSVNVGAAGYALFNIVEPPSGESLAAIGIFGPDKNLIAQRLLKDIPQNQLPESLGGSNNFKPAKVFGSTM